LPEFLHRITSSDQP